MRRQEDFWDQLAWNALAFLLLVAGFVFVVYAVLLRNS